MTRIFRAARLWALIIVAAMLPLASFAAPFAAYVMDARTGKPIYTQNADTKLHPASLTKMMTLYMAFTAVEAGHVRLDSKFTVSSNAAAEPPSKIGLRAGQQIELRYLLRAAAIKSANDAATTIGEGLAGSEEAFGKQMTAMARALGMRNTNFKNAHGLTQSGHYSTAHDMSLLGRSLFYDFPQYYNLFSRRSANAGIKNVVSTNRHFLNDYAGADGIKTGYTRAAGFNLTASAQRGRKRIIATVFGGKSTAQRNQTVAKLLDEGFRRVPERVRETRPAKPKILMRRVVRQAQVEPKPAARNPQPQNMTLKQSAPSLKTVAAARPAAAAATAGLPTKLSRSERPPLRPTTGQDSLAAALASAQEATPAPVQTASIGTPRLRSSQRPRPAPRGTANASADAVAQTVAEVVAEQMPRAEIRTGSLTLASSEPPKPRSETVILAAMGEGDLSEPDAVRIVSRPPNSGRSFGVSLGLYRSRKAAESLLVELALKDGDTLQSARRSVADTVRGFQPSFYNMTKAEAQLTCDRLAARQQTCGVIAN